MPKPLTFLLAALALCSQACGGGGGSGPAGPAWGEPVTLAERHDLASGALAGDGAGAELALWRQDALDALGNTVGQQVAARLAGDGAWGAPEVVEQGDPGTSLGVPAAAVDADGLGWMLWFARSGEAGAESTELRTSAIHLGAARWMEAPHHALIFPTGGLDDLRVAVGSDASARAAWLAPGDQGARVVTSRFWSGGVWEAAATPGGPGGAGMALAGLAGNGLGAYVVEAYRANDLPAGEAHHYPAGGGGEEGIAGWEPAVQSALAAHATAWAADGAGGLEAWLAYSTPGSGEPFRQAWPRRRDAAGAWTVAEAVALPRPAEDLAVFRQIDGSGWLAGTGSEGLWVAPLEGLTLGSARLLLPAPSLAAALVGVRDAAGRPALLWVQRSGAASEGIGFSRLDGAAWTAPVVLPGTAGVHPRQLRAAAGPGGLVATWEQDGDRTVLLRTATWR